MRALALVSLIALSSAIVSATPHPYIGSAGVILVCLEDGTGVGGACIPPGHIVPGPDGTVTFTIDDDVNPLVSGFVCQDVNADAICGDEGEAAAPICGSATVALEPGFEVFVFVDGPIAGSLNTCGALFSGGVKGTVDHT